MSVGEVGDIDEAGGILRDGLAEMADDGLARRKIAHDGVAEFVGRGRHARVTDGREKQRESHRQRRGAAGENSGVSGAHRDGEQTVGPRARLATVFHGA